MYETECKNNYAIWEIQYIKSASIGILAISIIVAGPDLGRYRKKTITKSQRLQVFY